MRMGKKNIQNISQSIDKFYAFVYHPKKRGEGPAKTRRRKEINAYENYDG